MTDAVWTRDEIESPCVQLCSIHPETQTCVGCYRTMEEITKWSAMTPDLRRSIMAELPEREMQLRQRRGGRRARVTRG